MWALYYLDDAIKPFACQKARSKPFWYHSRICLIRHVKRIRKIDDLGELTNYVNRWKLIATRIHSAIICSKTKFMTLWLFGAWKKSEIRFRSVVVLQIICLPYPVTSHWVSILDRIRYMKTWNSNFKVNYPNWIALHHPKNIFCFCGITCMSFWEPIIAYPNGDQWAPFS